MFRKLKVWIEQNTPFKLINPRWYQTPIINQKYISEFKGAVYLHTPTRMNIVNHTMCTQRLSALVYQDGKVKLMMNYVTPQNKGDIERSMQSIELSQDTVSLDRFINDLLSLRDHLSKEGYCINHDNSSYFGDPNGESENSLTNKLGYAILHGSSSNYYSQSAVAIINNYKSEEVDIYHQIESAAAKFDKAGF